MAIADRQLRRRGSMPVREETVRHGAVHQQRDHPPVHLIGVALEHRTTEELALGAPILSKEESQTETQRVVRAANDAARIDVLPVTLQFLLEQYQIPVPARLPYSLGPRIDTLP